MCRLGKHCYSASRRGWALVSRVVSLQETHARGGACTAGTFRLAQRGGAPFRESPAQLRTVLLRNANVRCDFCCVRVLRQARSVIVAIARSRSVRWVIEQPLNSLLFHESALASAIRSLGGQRRVTHMGVWTGDGLRLLEFIQHCRSPVVGCSVKGQETRRKLCKSNKNLSIVQHRVNKSRTGWPNAGWTKGAGQKASQVYLWSFCQEVAKLIQASVIR